MVSPVQGCYLATSPDFNMLLSYHQHGFDPHLTRMLVGLEVACRDPIPGKNWTLKVISLQSPDLSWISSGAPTFCRSPSVTY